MFFSTFFCYCSVVHRKCGIFDWSGFFWSFTTSQLSILEKFSLYHMRDLFVLNLKIKDSLAVIIVLLGYGGLKIAILVNKG